MQLLISDSMIRSQGFLEVKPTMALEKRESVLWFFGVKDIKANY